jgi:hypothetical protein
MDLGDAQETEKALDGPQQRCARSSNAAKDRLQPERKCYR